MGLNFLTKQMMKDLELLQQAILLNSGSNMPHLSINLLKIGTWKMDDYTLIVTITLLISMEMITQ